MKAFEAKVISQPLLHLATEVDPPELQAYHCTGNISQCVKEGLMKTSILTITALCSCFFCSHCDGGIITFVGSTGRLDYAFPQGATGFSRTSTDTRNVNVLLPRFDASLGTLQSATISYSSVASGSVLVPFWVDSGPPVRFQPASMPICRSPTLSRPLVPGRQCHS